MDGWLPGERRANPPPLFLLEGGGASRFLLARQKTFAAAQAKVVPETTDTRCGVLHVALLRRRALASTLLCREFPPSALPWGRCMRDCREKADRDTTSAAGPARALAAVRRVAW